MPFNLPDWDDIIILTPESEMSPEEQRARRFERYQRMQDSSIPEVARNTTTLMTYMDNIEDLISSMVVLGRPILKTVPRALPYFTAALTAAEILEMYKYLSPIGYIGRSGKRGEISFLEYNPFESRGVLSRQSKLSRTIPTFGEILELGQAAETVFGVGISLGPIMGEISELMFDSPFGGLLTEFYEVIDPFVSDALDIIRDSPLAYFASQDFTTDEHARMSVAIREAWEISKDYLQKNNIAERAKIWKDIPYRVRRPKNATTISLFSPDDWKVVRDGTVYIEGRYHIPTISGFSLDSRNIASDTLAQLAQEMNNTPEGQFICGNSVKIGQESIRNYEGNPEQLKDYLSPAAWLLMQGIERGILPKLPLDDYSLSKFTREALASQVVSESGNVKYKNLEDILYRIANFMP